MLLLSTGYQVLTFVEVAVPPNVLILDDSSAMVNTLDSILTSHGYHVESCDDGESCWQRLAGGLSGEIAIPDLLLLDLNVAGLDGLDLLDRIRGEDRLACMSVIVLTANGDAQMRTDALGAGASDYLAKPIELSELLDHVGDALVRLTAGNDSPGEADSCDNGSCPQPHRTAYAVSIQDPAFP